MATALATAEARLKAERNAKTMAKIDIEIKAGRLTVQQGMTLGMVYAFVTDSPDGQFAQVLVGMIQGEF